MDGKEGLQLLPGTKKRLGIKIPGENRFLYVGSAILGAAIVVAFWFNFNNQALETQMNGIDEQLFALEKKRDKKSEDSIKTIRQQILLTTQLIDDHIYLTKAFSRLGSLAHESIQVKNISYDLAGSKISIVGLSTSYTIIAHQLAALLSDDSIVDVSVGKMEPNPDGTIEFTMGLVYEKSKLLKNIKTE